MLVCLSIIADVQAFLYRCMAVIAVTIVAAISHCVCGATHFDYGYVVGNSLTELSDP